MYRILIVENDPGIGTANLVFAAFYILFYMATSRAYYKIVSETR